MIPRRNMRPVKWERAVVLLDGEIEEVRRTTYRYPGTGGDRLRVRYVVGDPLDREYGQLVEAYDVAADAHPELVREQRQAAERRLWSRLGPHPSVLGLSFGLVDAEPAAK